MNKEREASDVTLSFCCTFSEAQPIYRAASRRRISVSRYLRLLMTQRATPDNQTKHVKTLSKNTDL